MAIDFAQQIQRLLDERAVLAAALVRIDETLNGIGALLGTSPAQTPARRGRPPKRAFSTPPVSRPRPKRGRGSYDVTAEDFVLDIVAQDKNPTTREINAKWTAVGRGHTADNTLVKLVKTGRLRRIPLDGQRGSRYQLA
jgi:hypothetical protein